MKGRGGKSTDGPVREAIIQEGDEPIDTAPIPVQVRLPVGPAAHLNIHKMTTTRKAVFLRTLAETGSVAAAHEAATPWATAGSNNTQAWYSLKKTDPDFAKRWEMAQAAALATVEKEVWRRAMTPLTEPIFDKEGNKVGEKQKYDNRLLLALVRKLNPEEWSPQHKVTGEVTHTNKVDLSLITAEDRAILRELAQRQLDRQRRLALEAPPPDTIEEAEPIDAEYSEVQEDEDEP